MGANTSVLDHPARRMLHHLIEENWGLCESELGRASSFGRDRVKYHLRILVKARLVRTFSEGRKVHYFPPGASSADFHLAHAATRNVTRRRILEVLLSEPWRSWRSTAQEIGVTPRAVRWHIEHLASTGLVHVERQGARCTTRLSPVLEAIILDQQARPRPPGDQVAEINRV